MPTIEPAIQEAILDILPDDYHTAMRLMCQLIANMAISGTEPWGIDKVTREIKTNLDAYVKA